VERGGESRSNKRVRVGIYEIDKARETEQQYSGTMMEKAVRSQIDEDKLDGCRMIGWLN